MRLLLGLNKLLARLESVMLVSVLLTALIFSFLQVILRNFFDTGITWGDVFARHLVLWIGFFGATLSTLADQHIRIDALHKVLPERAKPIADLFICLFCIIVGYLLFHSALSFVAGERGAATTLFKGIPTWYFIVVMPIGFALITFRYFIKLIEMLYRFAGQKIEPAKPREHSEFEISVKVKLK